MGGWIKQHMLLAHKTPTEGSKTVVAYGKLYSDSFQNLKALYQSQPFKKWSTSIISQISYLNISVDMTLQNFASLTMFT